MGAGVVQEATASVSPGSPAWQSPQVAVDTMSCHLSEFLPERPGPIYLLCFWACRWGDYGEVREGSVALEPLELFPPKSRVLALGQSGLPRPNRMIYKETGGPWGQAQPPAHQALSRQRFTSKQDVIRHYNMHKKRDNSLQHGFMRFSPLDDCSVYYHGCHLNGKSTHYHCMQVPRPPPSPTPGGRPASGRAAPCVPSQGWTARGESPGGSGLGSVRWARVGPSPWPYLVRVKFSELFIQTDIFQPLTPRAALQTVPEEVFV